MFPIEVKYEETYSLIDLKVNQVVSASSGDALSLKLSQTLSTENYRITAD